MWRWRITTLAIIKLMQSVTSFAMQLQKLIIGLIIHMTSSKGNFIKFLVLSLICVLAVASRLFSVIRFESVIHEFDPYFLKTFLFHTVGLIIDLQSIWLSMVTMSLLIGLIPCLGILTCIDLKGIL